MSTPPVSNVSIFQELQSFYQNRRADIQQFGQALQSGDLNAAQQAYSTLTSLGQNGPLPIPSPSPAPAAPRPSRPLAKRSSRET